MKPLKDKLNESLLDIDDDTIATRADDAYVDMKKPRIEEWIRQNYQFYGGLKFYLVHGEIFVDVERTREAMFVKNKNIEHLTNGMFRWGKITGGFKCSRCTKLRSLEGAPNECAGFDCSRCTKLRSLKGAPKKCDWFYCFECTELRSLEGAPNEYKYFICSGCIKLTSLEGIPTPKKCYSFNCSKCTELKTLEGAPNKCDNFYCFECTGLRSLKGAPNECNWLDCSGCTELRSLEGAPVGAMDTIIDCTDCTNLIITDDDRKKYKIKS